MHNNFKSTILLGFKFKQLATAFFSPFFPSLFHVARTALKKQGLICNKMNDSTAPVTRKAIGDELFM